ncbi:MAG: hypothetical protein ACHQET_12810 [Chitinophagales bacterium]
MKSIIIFMGMFIFISIAGKSQQVSERTVHKFKVRLITVKEETMEGQLVQVSDSAMVISVNQFNSRKLLSHPLDTLSYQSIRELALHKKGHGAAGMGIGIGLGIGVGLLIGDAVGQAALKDHPPVAWEIIDPLAEYIISGAVIGMVSGGLIGAAIGSSIYKHFEINGDYYKFLAMKEKMKF